MNCRYWFALAVCLPVINLAACVAPPAPPQGLTEADRAALRQADAQWETSANANDFAAVGALYADEAMLLPPNAEAVRGRAAIQAYFEGFPPFSDLKLQPQEIEGCADVAYTVGTYSMMITLPGAATAMPDRGKYIEIWRKGADGSWKIERDIFNSDLAAPMPEPAPTPGN